MKYWLLLIVAFLIIGCSSKKAGVNNKEMIELTTYQKAKDYLSSHNYDQGIDAIDQAINENDIENLEELYYLKGFILHAYGETTDARAAYQQVIDNATTYSYYRKKAQQLLDLNIAEEQWELERKEKKEKDDATNESTSINKEELSDKLPFTIIEKQPRFPQCPDTTNTEIKKCSNMVIANHIRKTYNLDIGETFGVSQKVRTYVSYSIGIEGKLVHIDARSTNRFLTLEAKRVIYTMPIMIPGESDGKKVKVTYQIPVTYNPTT